MKYLYYDLYCDRANSSDFIIFQNEKDILIKRRAELNLTQQQVADRAGILLRQYQRFELGERNLSASSARIMLSVCEALLLDPYLFFGKGNENNSHTHVILPPIVKMGLEYAIPQHAYFLLVCAIPTGRVCTDDEIIACLRSVYGNKYLEIKPDKNCADLHLNDMYPYWRVVSESGTLINSIYSSKEKQKKMLEEEGIIIKNEKNGKLSVVDFQACRYDLEELKISILFSDEQLVKKFENVIKK